MIKLDKTILKTIFGLESKISSVKDEHSGNVHSFDYICNPDGSIRWIWPSETKKPLFLKFYTVSTTRAKLINHFLQILFYLPLIKRFYIKKLYVSVENELLIEKQFDTANSQYAIFTGTVGPIRKIVVYQENEGQSYFLKIPFGVSAHKSIINELEHSNLLGKWKGLFKMPELSMNSGILKSTDLKVSSKRETNLLFDTQMKLMDVMDETLYKGTLSKSFVEDTSISTSKEDKVLDDLSGLLKGFFDKKQNSDCFFSVNHGDFTPWNCAQENGEVKIYDFEFSSDTLPLYFDVFHFWTQQLIMCTDLSNQNILLAIKENWENSVFAPHAEALGLSYNDVLAFYLYFIAGHYYKVYSVQDEIHHQGYSLLSFLIEGLTVDLETDNSSLRSYHIGKVGDLLKQKQHCILKEFGLIQDIENTGSDIDMVLEKNQVNWFISNLSTKGLVKKVVTKKSFMQTIELYFTDNTFLSIDIITEFKQKWHHYLEAHTVLFNTVKKSDGLSYASNKLNVEYILLFYVLNGATIPRKYVNIIKGLSGKEFNESQKYIHAKYDIDITELIQDNRVYNSNMVDKLKTYSSRISKNQDMKNYVNYFIDTIRNLNFDYSKVITFSGVDGAGKTTIINLTKEMLEDTYRKKVVVLRHRPSILPILSAYVYGKEKASQRSMAKLPRQGNNRSKISSIIRLSYYLLDYIFGQFIVFFRYTMFNYVVIYDRYYFDFILDGKRSNINLNSRIPKFFFKFIMKPKLNFFLYADPEVILKRKKELSEADIIDLTKKYQELFFNLAPKSSSKFLTIENLELKKTMDLIARNIATNL